MDECGSAGNPSTASSRSLPVRANEEALHPDDWSSASEEESRLSKQPASPPGSQSQGPEAIHRSPEAIHQSPEAIPNPEETHQSPEEIPNPEETHKSSEDIPNPEETHQSPVEIPNPEETHQSPEEIPNPEETHQSPEEIPNPEETHQSLEEIPNPEETHKSSEDIHQSPEGTHKSPEETNQSPEETHQSPEVILHPEETHKSPEEIQRSPEETHQSPEETNKSPEETYWSLGETHVETHQSPVESSRESRMPKETHHPEDELDKLHLTKLTNNKDCPAKPNRLPTEEQKTSPSAKRQSREDQPIPDQDPPHLSTQQDPQIVPLIVYPTERSTMAPPFQAPPSTPEWFSNQAWPRPLASPSGDPKLCGFLQKQGGPLKTWKRRWFTYEGKNNQLFYYRTPQDVVPLGQVELCSATFSYPLKAERGTFHIKTPERTFVLKAVTQELMLYWLQQLQVKRWHHRQKLTCPEPTNRSAADNFLPMLKSPLGLVGEEAANVSLQGSHFSNVSIKHPLIEIQNSVHCLRKRPSQEWSQSVFHVEAPPADTSSTPVPPSPRTPTECLTPPPPVPLAEPAGQGSPSEGGESPLLFDTWSRRTRNRSMQVLRRDTLSSSSDRTSRLQQEKQMLMEEVKAQKELVWILHKALEASQLEKRTCAEFLAETDEQERLELLRHRERQAADLRGRLEEARMEAEAARKTLAQRDAELAELQEEVRMLTETNNAKQEVIVKLADHVTTCMSDQRRSVSSSQTFQQLQQNMEDLKDDIEAYKTQTKFLNSEIYQLTKLWRNSSEQEKSLMVKCAYLEASNCQVESRYLGVLRQLQDTKSLDPVQRKAVQKKIEDALKGELKSAVKLHMASDQDEYGFKIIPDYEVEDMKLLAKIQALEIRSHNLLHQEGVERPLLGRWAQHLAGRSDDTLCPSPELKGLVRGGIPQEYRQQVWSWMVRTRTRPTREQHPQRYQQLCERSHTSHHPASRQIELDLHRTLTTNQHFCSPSSPALQQLRRILLAFSWQNPAIGYCQGLNRLAAISLLVLQSEEEAFWCLVAVVEVIMPRDYYTKSLVASQADQRVLKEFLVEKLPRLAAHLEQHSVDVSLVTFNWFLVVFVESLPSDILLPLWDAFLYEGTKVIFRYALAVFKYKEEDILKIHDSVEIYQYLRFFTKTICDGRRLTNIAFTDMNPFPRRLLRTRRAFHLNRLQGELRDLEEQQWEFVTESAERKDKDLDVLVSEDDEDL